jgi:SAM-dependent methyltransferase
MIRPLDPASASTALAARVVLDVRDECSFRAGHLAGAGHVSLDELEFRRSELPPRGAPMLVLAHDAACAREAASRLEAMEYTDVAFLDGPLRALPGGCDDRGEAARLWRPSPFLEAVLPAIPRGRALDLASGAGREAVYLALHGFEVEAWDHDRGALERAEALAARHGVRVTTVVRNLERREPDLPEARHDLVTVFRFLHRPLLPHVARAVAPGGWLVYETFRRGQERYGRPRHPRFLLDQGELPRSFPELVVERYEEVDPDGGPVMARLLARRPA